MASESRPVGRSETSERVWEITILFTATQADAHGFYDELFERFDKSEPPAGIDLGMIGVRPVEDES